MEGNPPNNGPGILEIGVNSEHQVVMNLPRDMTGHIVFSPAEARNLAFCLRKNADDAEGLPVAPTDFVPLSFVWRLVSIRSRVKDAFDLCGFLGKIEKEHLVAQTIHAACNNYEQYGEPCSILGNIAGEAGVAYRSLIEDGYFTEGQRTLGAYGTVTVIFPTEKLIHSLFAFLNIPSEQ